MVKGWVGLDGVIASVGFVCAGGIFFFFKKKRGLHTKVGAEVHHPEVGVVRVIDTEEEEAR